MSKHHDLYFAELRLQKMSALQKEISEMGGLPKGESKARSNAQERDEETEEQKWKRWMDPGAIRDQYIEARFKLAKSDELEFRRALLNWLSSTRFVARGDTKKANDGLKKLYATFLPPSP